LLPIVNSFPPHLTGAAKLAIALAAGLAAAGRGLNGLRLAARQVIGRHRILVIHQTGTSRDGRFAPLTARALA
jgi:hypothetical protein